MKRSAISLLDIADYNNLLHAAYQAAKGKRSRPDIEAFLRNIKENLQCMSMQILDNTIPIGNMTHFKIYDPKERIIHAPSFEERVVHHAIMNYVGPVLDKALIYDTFACRVGKGTLAAVNRVKHHIKKYPWYVKIDFKSYFASINHENLKNFLRRKLKDTGLVSFIERIIDSHEDSPGKGLPIGALTSQHFANYYLNAFDRYLLEQCGVAGMVRYMDDVIWWCHSRDEAHGVFHKAKQYTHTKLDLIIKNNVQINKCSRGIPMCGYRIYPQTIRLSRRRRTRYIEARNYWEKGFNKGTINSLALQAGYAAAKEITAHAHATTWRKEQLRLNPTQELCTCI